MTLFPADIACIPKTNQIVVTEAARFGRAVALLVSGDMSVWIWLG